MMYAVIVGNVLGFTVRSIDPEHHLAAPPTRTTQGQTMGAVSALNSLMAVIAPAHRRAAARQPSRNLPRGRLAHRRAVLFLRAAAARRAGARVRCTSRARGAAPGAPREPSACLMAFDHPSRPPCTTRS